VSRDFSHDHQVDGQSRLDRSELVQRLVLGQSVSPTERWALGPFVTRSEIAAAIAGELRRHGRFPVDAQGRGGLQLAIAPSGVLLRTRRCSRAKSEIFASMTNAVERYIESEIGPSCGGLRIRE
jgi:hypothetical protein